MAQEKLIMEWALIEVVIVKNSILNALNSYYYKGLARLMHKIVI